MPLLIPMSEGTDKNEVVEKIDKLLESDDLTTRAGLRLAFSALRDAVSLMSGFRKNFNDIETKVNTMWNGYRILVWVAGIIGFSVIGLIWALITGQATITFAP